MMLPLARQNTTLILGILDHAKYFLFSQSIILRQITVKISISTSKILITNKQNNAFALVNF